MVAAWLTGHFSKLMSLLFLIFCVKLWKMFHYWYIFLHGMILNNVIGTQLIALFVSPPVQRTYTCCVGECTDREVAGPEEQHADVAVVLGGVEVRQKLPSITLGCVILFGLLHALNSYPKDVKGTFKVFQKTLMELDTFCVFTKSAIIEKCRCSRDWFMACQSDISPQVNLHHM